MRRRLNLIGQIHIEMYQTFGLIRRRSEVQMLSYQSDGHTLRQERNQSTKEYHVEEHICCRHSTCLTHNSEDDRHGSFESHPTEHQLITRAIAFERHHTEEDCRRSGKTDHHNTDDEARQPNLQTDQLTRTNHQTQHQEHYQLAEPGQTIEERFRLTFAGELIIPDDQTTYIHGQIGITLQVIGRGKNEDTSGKHHDWIERLAGQLYATHEPHQAFA